MARQQTSIVRSNGSQRLTVAMRHIGSQKRTGNPTWRQRQHLLSLRQQQQQRQQQRRENLQRLRQSS